MLQKYLKQSENETSSQKSLKEDTRVRTGENRIQDNVDEVKILSKENESLKMTASNMQDSISNLEDKALRAHAEMENIRRLAQKDIQNAHRFALERFAIALLPVIDSIEKSTEICNSAKDTEVILKGNALTIKLFLDVLKKFGITQNNPCGELFDPNKHEAVATSLNPDISNNIILNVVQKGYELHDRVLRPARVVVVKN